MEILLDGKNMLNQDENKYSKRFRIVIKPGRSFIGYVIWERVKGIVIWMFEEMCLICVTLIDGDSNTLVLNLKNTISIMMVLSSESRKFLLFGNDSKL